MRVELNFTFDEEDDGFSGYISSSRDNVDTLEEMAQFMTDALRGASFSYVENVGFEKDDGSVVFGTF